MKLEKDVCFFEFYVGMLRKFGVVLLMICSLSICFKLLDEILNYIISIIVMFLFFGYNMIKSVYVLKEYLRKFVSFFIIYYLCFFCGIYVEKDFKRCIN